MSSRWKLPDIRILLRHWGNFLLTAQAFKARIGPFRRLHHVKQHWLPAPQTSGLCFHDLAQRWLLKSHPGDAVAFAVGARFAASLSPGAKRPVFWLVPGSLADFCETRCMMGLLLLSRGYLAQNFTSKCEHAHRSTLGTGGICPPAMSVSRRSARAAQLAATRCQCCSRLVVTQSCHRLIQNDEPARRARDGHPF